MAQCAIFCNLAVSQRQTMTHKIVLVTGASSGFGRAIAQQLSHEGHIVFGTSRQACHADYCQMSQMDVTQSTSVTAVIFKRYCATFIVCRYNKRNATKQPFPFAITHTDSVEKNMQNRKHFCIKFCIFVSYSIW